MSVYTRQDFLDLYKLIKKKQHKKLYPDLTTVRFNRYADANLHIRRWGISTGGIINSVGYYRRNHVPGMFDRVVKAFFDSLNKDCKNRFIEIIKTNENLYHKFILIDL
jgi:hypothetical protein